MMQLNDIFSFSILAVIVMFFVRNTSCEARQRLEICRLNRKLDFLFIHHGIELPPPLSPEVQTLAKDPGKKIAAIKLHRRQNPGLGLADAKYEIEEFFIQQKQHHSE